MAGGYKYFEAIEKHAGLKPAVIQTIRRQDPQLGATARERGFIRRYRAAAKYIAPIIVEKGWL